MNYLENFNKLQKISYFDKEDWEEDEPIKEIPLDIHKIFEQKEIIFNQICNDVLVDKGIVKIFINYFFKIIFHI